MCRWSPNGVHTLDDLSRLVFHLSLDVFDDIEKGVRSQPYHLKEMLEEVITTMVLFYILYYIDKWKKKKHSDTDYIYILLSSSRYS